MQMHSEHCLQPECEFGLNMFEVYLHVFPWRTAAVFDSLALGEKFYFCFSVKPAFFETCLKICSACFNFTF